MYRFARASVVAIFVSAICPIVASAQSGAFAWVSADHTKSSQDAAYTAPAERSRNSSGGANTIDRLQTGVYLVTFKKLGWAYGGNMQVNAVGSAGERCHAMWMDELGDDKRLILGCTNAAGDYLDSNFTASFAYYFAGPDSEPGRAYTRVDDPLDFVDDEASERRFNSSNEAIGFVRVSEGNYLMRFHGQSSPTPNYRVTAYGLFSTSYCKVMSTSTGGLFVVGCFDATGARDDVGFFASYDETNVHNSIAEAHLRVNGTTLAISDAFRAGSGAMTVERFGPTGVYVVQIPNIASATSLGTVYVSATSNGSTVGANDYCEVAGWGPSSTVTGTIGILVLCVNGAGGLTNNGFTLSYMR